MQVVEKRKWIDPSGSLHRCCMAVVSSCVRCSVKSANERNPRRVLQVSRDTAGLKPEEGVDDVKSA